MFRPRYFFPVLLGIIAIAIALLRPGHEAPPRVIIPGLKNCVLFISNSEHGNSNVFLATAQALLLHHPEIELHYATFAKRAKDVASVNRYASKQSPDAGSVLFHEIVSGRSFEDAINRTVGETIHPPGLRGSAKLCKDIESYLMPWTGPEYLAIVEELSRVILEVDPAIVALDSLFGPGLDATRHQNRRHAILSPNSLKDNFAELQPLGSVLWKYPAMGSGYTYPVPLHLIPANIYMNLRLAFSVIFNPTIAKKKAYLKEKGLPNPVGLFTIYRPDDLTWISAGSLDAEFPMPIIPENVIPVGPITLSTAPASQQDPELAAWLEQAPTMMINLGSHVDYDEKSAVEMAGAIKLLLDATDVQVIWKFNKRKMKDGTREGFSDEFLSQLSEEITSGRLRLEKWLTIDPPAILETGNIVAAVNHGGANSFFEAMINGVPQIVLPLWIDLYDYATRAEYLGIGIWGSQATAPDWTTEELGSAFLKLVGNGEDGIKMHQNARALAKKFQGKPGRELAAEEIAKLAGLGLA